MSDEKHCQVRVGDKVRIKREFCDTPEEAGIDFIVVTAPEGKGRVDIVAVSCLQKTLRPMQVVDIDMIEIVRVSK